LAVDGRNGILRQGGILLVYPEKLKL